MPPWWSQAAPHIHEEINSFTAKVRRKVDTPPEEILRRKNPFLFRARVTGDVYDLCSAVLNAFLSSSEETMFGNTIERVAFIIAAHARNGQKSGIAGIDIEYPTGSLERTIISVKSGPSWGNSSQIARLRQHFNQAGIILRQGGIAARPIEGITYGPSTVVDRGTHLRIVGQAFWREISNWDNTHQLVLSIIGDHAANGLAGLRDTTTERMVDYLTDQGVANASGNIDWPSLCELAMPTSVHKSQHELL